MNQSPVELLQQLGFGEYEARAYLSLLRRSPVTGYELAKESGVPRPNIYAVLQKLEERGAAVRLDTPTGARYAPLSPDELVQRLEARFQGALGAAQRSLEEVKARPAQDYVWNLHGYGVMLEHARSLLETAQKSVLIALWPAEAQALAGALAQADERGVAITLLCLQSCPQECDCCRGRIYRYAAQPELARRWLVLAQDSTELLAGEIDSQQEALAARTRRQMFVELASWYIRHSIALAAVLSDLGERLEQQLCPETRSLLASLGPAAAGGGWLKHMRDLLAQSGDRHSAP